MRAVVAALLFAWATSLAAHEGHAGEGAAPQLRPALAIGATLSPDGRLWLVGVDADGALFVQSRAYPDGVWSAARPLPIGDDKVAADGENRPKIAFGPENRVVVSYTRPLSRPYTGEIRLLRSTDGGATFSAPVTLHRDRQIITHRFESIAFDRKGTLHTVWIDKRDQVAAAGANGGRSNYAGAALYRNESNDGGLTFGPDIKVADHSCECCRIALAPGGEGKIAALWRHVFAPNIRDHGFSILDAPTPVVVRASFDGWPLDACPHHGPGLAAAQDGGYHAVWFGEKAGRAAVRYGRLAADGKPRGDVRELPDSRAEHADVSAAGAQVAVVWRSFDGMQTRLRAWVSADGGTHFALRELAASSDGNDHPRLVSGAAGIGVVWRTAKEIHVIPIEP